MRLNIDISRIRVMTLNLLFEGELIIQCENPVQSDHIKDTASALSVNWLDSDSGNKSQSVPKHLKEEEEPN